LESKPLQLELKRVKYSPDASVDYVVLAGMVFFCGVDNIRHLAVGSTMPNATGAIIRAIKRDLGESVRPSRFFVVLTSTNHFYEGGQYDIREVRMTQDVRHVDYDWIRCKECPAEILRVFARHIGKHPRRAKCQIQPGSRIHITNLAEYVMGDTTTVALPLSEELQTP
jgi:hypothetical protein